MAEVLEGRHTDAEIASADVMQVRDMGEDTAEATKKRIAQHALFVQIDGTRELIDYLLRNIELSPSAYAPSGVSARILAWAKEQQRQSDLSMVATEETTMDLPDIKVEGYEFLFTEHLHALDLDIAGQNVDGNFAATKEEAAKGKDDLDQTSAEGKAVAAAFRVLLALPALRDETTKKAVLDQIRDTDMLRSLICLADDVTNGRWYPANVGPNLLLIMQDLCRLPSTTLEEQPTMVILGDMIDAMLKSALSMSSPSSTSSGRASRRSATGCARWASRRKLLIRNIILTYGVMCETIAHMHFADDAKVNVACRELALQCLHLGADLAVASTSARMKTRAGSYSRSLHGTRSSTSSRCTPLMQTLLQLVQRQVCTSARACACLRARSASPGACSLASWVRLEPRASGGWSSSQPRVLPAQAPARQAVRVGELGWVVGCGGGRAAV